MNETIIFAPSCRGTELIRTLARFGKNTLGVRVEGATGLSRIALMRSGISVQETFLPRREEPSVYNAFLNQIPYFAAASYADCEQLASAIFSIRSLIPEQEEETVRDTLSGGEFQNKNLALAEAYTQYQKSLQDNQFIDTIGLIRKTIAEANPLTADFLILKEYPLSPLEKSLLQKLSGGNYQEIRLIDLFEKQESAISEIVMTDAYGASNEVEDILGYIYQNNLPLDQCVIAVADSSSYAQLIYDESLQYNIPVSFGNGIPIINSNPAELLKLYNEWDTKGFHGVNALEKLLTSEALDRQTLGLTGIHKICKVAGQLRISSNGKENEKRIQAYRGTITNDEDLETLNQVTHLAEELAKGCRYFISTYSMIREGFAGRVDRSAIGVITNTLDAYTKFSENDISLIIPDLLAKTVCSEISHEGELYVSSISNALASLRPHLFVAGLSASIFPGSPKENYLLLDSDYLLFGNETEVPTSANRIRDKKEKLLELLQVASALGVNIRMSYAGYQLAEHKEDNPSSVLFEIYQAAHPDASIETFRKSLRHTGFFDHVLSGVSKIGQAYNRNIIGEADAAPEQEEIQMADLEKAWSPSALEIFFSCPRRFYLTRILKIQEPEDDDPFTVINADQLGTLAHTQMDHLAEKHVSKKEFLKRAENDFDDFLKSRPPLHPEAVTREKQAFLKMMENAYDGDPGNEVLSAEDKWTVEHESGVKLFGYPDRIEKVDDEHCMIADYKTKRKIDHVEDDVDTCLQVLLYAYMAEKQGIPVTSCEYRYIRRNDSVTCQYNDAIKEALARKLEYFKQCLETSNYPCNPGKEDENCKYCKCAGICGKERKEVTD